SSVAQAVPPSLDAIVMQGLADKPWERFVSAEAMAAALEEAVMPATTGKVAAWMSDIAGSELAERAELVATIESRDTSDLAKTQPAAAPPRHHPVVDTTEPGTPAPPTFLAPTP